MDGFQVETTALAQTGGKYNIISARLSEDASRLRGLIGQLSGQTIGDDLSGLLRDAIRSVEISVEESRELGNQCAKIAGVYDRVEGQAAAVVAALTSVSPFADMNSFCKIPDSGYSAYRPAKPVLFSGNRLPCESWLLDRAIKASLEGET